MNYRNTRISKLRDYLFDVIDTLATDNKYQINADMLDNEAENYSLNKIAVDPIVEQWITGYTRYQDVYSFRSKKAYSQDVINNLKNIGFFEEFERIIKENNENKILPEIEGIESIECLNCGSMNIANTNTATFDIQIRIIYGKDEF